MRNMNANMNIKGHIHIPLLLSYSMIAIVKRNAKKYH